MDCASGVGEMNRKNRTILFLFFLLAQLIAGGAAALVWPVFLRAVHVVPDEYLTGPCILVVGILAFAIFILLGKKEGFLQLVEMELISARNIFLWVFSFLIAALVGLTVKELVSFYLRSHTLSTMVQAIFAASSVASAFLAFDVNLLFAGRIVGILETIGARIESIKRRSLFANPSLVALLVTGIFFAVFFSVFRIGYAINDDVAMISIASGYLGEAAPVLVFSNVILGFLLKPLYSLPSRLNWEILLFLLIHFFSIWTLLFLLLVRRLKAGVSIFGTFAILLTDVYFLINITFTTTAAFAALAGFCLLAHSTLTGSPVRKRPLVFAVLLLVVACLIRFESLALIALIILPALVVTYIQFQLRPLLLTLFVAGILVVGCYAFDRIYIASSPDWRAYYLYNQSRSALQDTPRMGNLAGTYQSVGWTRNDLASFEHWFFPDREIYSLQNLQALVAHTPSESANLGGMLGFVVSRLFSLVSLPYIFLLAAVWLLAALYEIPIRKVLLPTLLLAFVSLAIGTYLAGSIKIPNRVLLPSLTASVIFGFFLFVFFTPARVLPPSGTLQDNASNPPRISWLGTNSLLLALTLAVGLVLGQTALTSRANVSHQAVYRQILSDLDALQAQGTVQPGALIISPAYGLPLEWANPLLLEFPKMQYLDMGWLTFSPPYELVLQKYQVASLTTALYQNGNVYLMATPSVMEDVRQFILEHKGVEVAAQALYTMPTGAAGSAYEHSVLYRLVQKK
jgi:hypothetical protein